MTWSLVLSEQLQQIMTALALSVDDLALVLQTDKKTVQRWLANESFPQPGNRARLEQLVALIERLDDTFVTREGAHEWLRSPIGYFGGLCPLDALLRGRVDRVDAALEALDAGIFV